jgi:hypothetical protein
MYLSDFLKVTVWCGARKSSLRQDYPLSKRLVMQKNHHGSIFYAHAAAHHFWWKNKMVNDLLRNFVLKNRINLEWNPLALGRFRRRIHRVVRKGECQWDLHDRSML